MDHKAYIEELIAKGKLEEAIKELLRGAKEDGDLKNNLILLSARLNSVKREEMGGLQSSDQITMNYNRIRFAITSYLSEYEPPADIEFGQNS